MKTSPIQNIKRKILESRRIAVTSHLRPDGDSICTSLALYFMGELLGKKIDIYIKDRIPFPINHFPDTEKIRIGQIPPDQYDFIILLECANVSRSGQDSLEAYFKINIDHHHSNDFYGNINWVDPEAAAVACMAFRLGEALGIEFNTKIALHLYAAIVSDTGSFHFSNTNADVFEICHQLVRLGVVPFKVSEMMFHNNSPEKIKLLGVVLSTLKMNPAGNIAMISMFKSVQDELNLKEIETEDITTNARSIKGAQMVLFFKEIKTNVFRVSVRSKGDVSSALVAEHYGGGGHLHAAGFTVSGDHDRLLKEIPEIISHLLKKSLPERSKNININKSWTD
jgi:phosphoesterase RecJ-like protein